MSQKLARFACVFVSFCYAGVTFCYVLGSKSRGPVTLVLRMRDARYAPVTVIFLISAMALAGFSPLGHTVAQFMIV